MANNSFLPRMLLRGAILAALGMAYVAYRLLYPYNEVTADIQAIPPGVDFVCLVAAAEHAPQAMEWSVAKVVPVAMHPDSCTVSWLPPGESRHRAKVRWIFTDRVGVLHRTVDRQWIVAWFEPPQSQPQRRSLLLGGGRAPLDLATADSEQTLTEEQLHALGMEYSLKQD